MRDFKSSLLRLLLIPGAAFPFSFFVKGRAAVFMLHRFKAPELGVRGHDLRALREALAFLRKKGYQFLSIEELLVRAAEKRPLQHAVAFTIDDGYLEQATVAAPVFAEYDCPVTTFVTSGFLDGTLWFWWDQVEYIFTNAKRREFQFPIEDEVLSLKWDDASRLRTQAIFTEKCKEVPHSVKGELISHLAEAAEVLLPSHPPECYRPMSWDQARGCEKSGMTFGPHTLTHPILSRTTDADSFREISESWTRLTSEVGHPVPVFCYPNGRPQDFSDREVNTLKTLKFLGAVTGTPGYVELGPRQQSPDGLFHLPRFGYRDSLPHIIQCVSGAERFKELLRGGRG